MSGPIQNDVIATVRARELLARIGGASRLDRIVDELLEQGVDRADLDLVSGAGARAPVPCEIVTGHDANNAAAVAIGSTLAFGTMGAIGLGMLAGASPLLVAAAALGAAAASLGLGTAIAWRLAGRPRQQLDAELAAGRLRLAVRVRSDADENRLHALLTAAGAMDVEARERDVQRRASDVPLWRLCPDPWLSDERLAAVRG